MSKADRVMDDIDRDPENYEPGDEFPDRRGSVVARPDWTYYKRKRPFAAGLWQYGTCANCATKTVSQAKYAECPNCGERVYGT